MWFRLVLVCSAVKVKSISKIFYSLRLVYLTLCCYLLWVPSFSSINRVMFLITLFADISLPTMLIQSSAYLTKFSPLCSISLSNSFRMMLARSGDRLPPYAKQVTMQSKSMESLFQAHFFLRCFDIVLRRYLWELFSNISYRRCLYGTKHTYQTWSQD